MQESPSDFRGTTILGLREVHPSVPGDTGTA